MSVYKRGGTYWFEFEFNGSRIRESAKTTSKILAREAERARRRRLEESANGIVRREAPPLSSNAAERWLESKSTLTALGRAYYRQYVGKLKKHFASKLVSDITADAIAALQRKPQVEGLSGRQINCEVATLRAILKRYKLWAEIAEQVRWLREGTDIGRALSAEDEARLLEAIAQSISPALYPFFILSLDSGLRPSETRALRRRDLNLQWHNGAISQGELIVSRSKTRAGTGRVVPLTRRACGALTLWLARFPGAGPHSYLFPFHHVGFAGYGRKPHLWAIDLDRPMGNYSYKRAYKTACAKAGLDFRLYDARHTFFTRLAENPTVSEETIRQLAGHVSPRMLARYAHIRAKARRDAIPTLEASEAVAKANSGGGSPQNPPHSGDAERRILN